MRQELYHLIVNLSKWKSKW